MENKWASFRENFQHLLYKRYVFFICKKPKTQNPSESRVGWLEELK